MCSLILQKCEVWSYRNVKSDLTEMCKVWSYRNVKSDPTEMCSLILQKCEVWSYRNVKSDLTEMWSLILQKCEVWSYRNVKSDLTEMWSLILQKCEVWSYRNVKSDLTEMWSLIIVWVCCFFLFVLILSYNFFYFLSLNTLNKHNHVGPKFHLQKKEPYHTHVLDCQFHTLIVWSSEELKIHGYS
jgi:hypothetical protein